MSISTVVTMGYGSFGSVNRLPTLGYSIGAPPVSYAFTLEAGRVFVPGMAVATTRVPGAERVRVIK